MMETQTTHTPTPLGWTLRTIGRFEVICSPMGEPLFRCLKSSTDHERNLAVRAVNAHAELVALLTWIEAFTGANRMFSGDNIEEINRRCRVALARAEGGAA